MRYPAIMLFIATHLSTAPVVEGVTTTNCEFEEQVMNEFERQLKPPPALQNLPSFSPKLKEQGFDEGAIARVFLQATTFLNHFAPEGDHLLRWTGDRDILDGKKIQFLITTSDDPKLERARQANLNTGLPVTADAMTLVEELADGTKQITVAIAVDQMVLDKETGEPATHLLMPKMAAALAHEVFGNVQAMLYRPLDKMTEGDRADRITQEINAFNAGLRFIDRMDDRSLAPLVPNSEQRKGLLDALKLIRAEHMRQRQTWVDAAKHFGE